MAERQPIPKSVRFEVFKRDSFTCQYCGQKAPDVVLQIDHMKPVTEGGDNHIMNLVTSCVACNAGKGACLLDDDSVLAKQMVQLEELNERRMQIEMLMEWRNDLLSLESLKVEKIVSVINAKGSLKLNDAGVEIVAGYVKKHPFDELLHATDESFRIYFKGDTDSWVTAVKKIGGVLKIARASQDKPYLKRLFYIRGILRNRVYVNEGNVMGILEGAHLAGASLEDLERQAATCQSWTRFIEYCYAILMRGVRDGAH